MEALEVISKGDERLTITYDPDPMNPREWDNFGEMICFHRRYRLGDTGLDYKESNYESWGELYHALVADGASHIHALYLYDHGGITISMSKVAYDLDHPTRTGWDSGQVGFTYATPRNIQAWGIDPNDSERITGLLAAEVESYDNYLTGQVYAYKVEQLTKCECCGHTTTEVIDSCGGFESVEIAIQEAGWKEAANA